MSNIVLIGKYASSDYRFRVAKSGYNVLTETDDRNIIFDSSFNIFKIYQTGTVSITVSGNQETTASITHSLGYEPMVLWAFEGDEVMPGSSDQTIVSNDQVKIKSLVRCTITTTQATWHFYNAQNTAGSKTIRYYVLIETAATS